MREEDDGGSGAAGFVMKPVTADGPVSAGDITEFCCGDGLAERVPVGWPDRVGSGRVYTLTSAGSAAVGNPATCSATVTVPRDKS